MSATMHQQRVEALLEEIARRRAELQRRKTYGVRARALVAEKLELAHLLEVVLDQLASVVEYTEAFIAYQQGDELCVNNYRGALPREQAIGIRIPAAEAALYQEVVKTGRPVIIHDIEQGPDTYSALRRRRTA